MPSQSVQQPEIGISDRQPSLVRNGDVGSHSQVLGELSATLT